MAVYLLEDEDTASLLPMKTRFFNDTYKRIKVSVTVYITCAEPVYGIIKGKGYSEK